MSKRPPESKTSDLIKTMEELLEALVVHEYRHNPSRHLAMAYIDEAGNNNGTLLTAAAAAALHSARRVRNCQNRPQPIQEFQPPPARKLLKLSDLLLCPDEEFSQYINVSRKTIQTIFQAVQVKYEDFQFNDFLMFLYYLSSETTTLESVAGVFGIEDGPSVMTKLVDTSLKLDWLKASAKILLPLDEFDEDEMVNCFKRRTGLPDILGALAVFKFDCLDGSCLSVLTICDYKHYFRHLSFSNSSQIIQEVIKSSPIYERLLQDHPKHYSFLCPAEGYPSLPQLLPGLQDNEFYLFEEMKDFDFRHNQVVNNARIAVKKTVTRFPKLDSLETLSPEIVTAAFMLHNFCIETRDNSINYDDIELLYGMSPLACM